MKPSQHDSLDIWLAYLEQLHTQEIDLGLERIRQVAERLELSDDAIKITVGGTNGKGSTCAMLDSIYRCAGYAVGVYTSPHLVQFNERIKIHGEPVSDQMMVDQLVVIEEARGDISLTYFEYTTLTALLLFKKADLDVWILEVGLGGRLDAVNIIDADCAIVTSVDIDHIAYLGDDREVIGFEKAHIYRKNSIAICADPSPPRSLIDYATQVGAMLYLIDRDFSYQQDENQWTFLVDHQKWHLDFPALKGEHQLMNASAVLMTLHAFSLVLPVSEQAIQQGLSQATVIGRFQTVLNQPRVILDVAHNPHAMRSLVQNFKALQEKKSFSKVSVVMGVLKDKDLSEMIACLQPYVDDWYCATLTGARGRSSVSLSNEIKALLSQSHNQTSQVFTFDSPKQAYVAAFKNMRLEDCCIVLGSFLTVADVYPII